MQAHALCGNELPRTSTQPSSTQPREPSASAITIPYLEQFDIPSATQTRSKILIALATSGTIHVKCSVLFFISGSVTDTSLRVFLTMGANEINIHNIITRTMVWHTCMVIMSVSFHVCLCTGNNGNNGSIFLGMPVSCSHAIQ